MQITPRLFVSLAVAAIVSVVAAGVIYAMNNQWAAGDVTGKALFPQLSEAADEIAVLELTQGEKSLTMARDGDRWVARDHGGYPVRTGRVRSVIVRLTQAELIEPKTRKPERYGALSLGDPTKKGAEALRLRLLGGEGKMLAETVLGEKRYDAFGSGRSGTYVRKPGDPQTWLANLDIKAEPKLKSWTDAIFFKIDKTGIETVRVEHPGEPPLEFAKASGGQPGFELATAPPEGGKLKEDGPPVDTTVEGFAEIELEDVRKLDGTPAGERAATATLETQDGLTVSYRMRKEGEAYWLSLEAEGTGDAAKKAGTINDSVKGWEYRIPSWKADILFKRRSEFFETS